MLTYIIQIILFQVLFLAVYDFFLSKETFHNYNRWYLLGTPLISFVLPLIKIPTIQKAVPQELMVYLPEIMLSPQKAIEKTSYYTTHNFSYLSLLFWAGVLFFSIVFLIKIRKIVLLIVKNEKINKKTYQLILLPKQRKAFSFFNFIFLGKKIPVAKQEKIIQHELIHAQQKHSADLLFFELLRIVMWFNPMVYFYQRKISLLHEYISDAELVKTTEKHDYFNRLLSETFQVENLSFVNQFYKQSYLKKRITMMTKNQSNPFKKAKYLLLLPLLASMLIYTSCETNDVLPENSTVQNEKLLKPGDVDKLPILMLKEVVVGNENKVMEVVPNAFSASVRMFVAKKFNGDLVAESGLKTGGRIISSFVIDKKGKVKDIKVRAPNEILKNEALRVINALPVEKPAIKNGKPVAIQYTLPIKLGSKGTNLVGSINDVPFAIIENVPVYPGCTGTKKELTDCLNSHIRKFVGKQFNNELAKTLGLSKGKKRIIVQFRIDKTGNITDVIARAPHPALKAEAIRVAKLLPKMQPGKQRGKAVGMRYTLPIAFNVD